MNELGKSFSRWPWAAPNTWEKGGCYLLMAHGILGAAPCSSHAVFYTAPSGPAASRQLNDVMRRRCSTCLQCWFWGPAPLASGLPYLEESTSDSISHPGVSAPLVTMLQGQHITTDLLEVSEWERERERGEDQVTSITKLGPELQAPAYNPQTSHHGPLTLLLYDLVPMAKGSSRWS